MRSKEAVGLTFLPGAVTVQATSGDTILDAALDHGIGLGHECGGNCACTTCHVRIVSGGEHLSGMEAVEEERLRSAEGLTEASRLGCQVILLGGSVTAEIVESL